MDTKDPTVISLIGPSGSGKSSIGKALARKLNWEFFDTDKEIERRQGRTVADIFQNDGEPRFRQCESDIVDELLYKKPKFLVISSGGGLPVFRDNFEKMEKFSILVYLTAPLEVLVTRINQGEERPLLAMADADGKSNDAESKKAKLGNLIAQRESIYNRARYKINTSNSDVERLADEIICLAGLVLHPGI